MTPMGPDTGRRHADWGIWEAGAVAFLFSLPAAIHVSAMHWAGRPHLDAFEWLVVALAVVAAVALSLAIGGISHARAFLSIGLVTCCAWTFGGVTFGRGTGMDVTYFVLAVVTFTGQINLVPVALLSIIRTGERTLGARARSRLGRPIFGSIASVGLLDLFPVVYLVSPREVAGGVTIGWIAAWAVAAGIFAGAAARPLPRRGADQARTAYPIGRPPEGAGDDGDVS